jgi:hypothetical protein
MTIRFNLLAFWSLDKLLLFGYSARLEKCMAKLNQSGATHGHISYGYSKLIKILYLNADRSRL